jgi:hypothetical protein
VALGCFESYKIDYSDGFAEPRFLRRSNVQIAFRGMRYGIHPVWHFLAT